MPQYLRKSILAAVLAVCCSSAGSIEVPKTDSAAPAAQPAPAVDETAFYEMLRRSSQLRTLKGLRIPEEVIAALSRGAADVAVSTLQTAAMRGGSDENIALVRLQHWCNRMTNSQSQGPQLQEQIDKLDASLPEDRRARAAGVLKEEARYRQSAAAGCRNAQFDFTGIERRLRAAAEAGDPASATELAPFLRDKAKSLAMLKAAAAKNFAPAVHALATQRLIAVQRNENTEDVASIRTLFKQAGRTYSRAKLELANCMAVGCDGYPPDAAAATSFGLDAARDGEPLAFISMIPLRWGVRLPRTQLLAWHYFGDRLNEAGCNDGDGYIRSLTMLNQSIKALEQGQDEKFITGARELAEDYWRQHRERAQREQGCLPRA